MANVATKNSVTLVQRCCDLSII